MKSFLKFVVTIIVVGVIGYTVCFFINNSENYANKELSGEIKVEEDKNDLIEEEQDAVLDEEIIENYESDSENLENNSESGDSIHNLSKQVIIDNINTQVNIIKQEGILNSSGDKLSSDFLSDSAKNFMRNFGTTELDVVVNIKERCIEVIPMSDFVDNMIYYYDEYGNLIMYESVSNTIGGNSRYYFNDGHSVDAIHNYEEIVNLQEEYVFDVLNRANRIYDRYLKK